MGVRRRSSALRKTKRVCGKGPSDASTRVVLPWSTCAMMAMLRRAGLATDISSVYRGRGSGIGVALGDCDGDRSLLTRQTVQQGACLIGQLLIVEQLLRKSLGIVAA